MQPRATPSGATASVSSADSFVIAEQAKEIQRLQVRTRYHCRSRLPSIDRAVASCPLVWWQAKLDGYKRHVAMMSVSGHVPRSVCVAASEVR